MLKGISKLLSPDMLKVLCQMGHFDEIVISDGNFPAYTKNNTVIECSGDVVEVLLAVLPLFPVCDAYVMAVDEKDLPYSPPILNDFEKAFKEQGYIVEIKKEKRQEFYNRAMGAYAVIHTKDSAPYANIILKKDVV